MSNTQLIITRPLFKEAMDLIEAAGVKYQVNDGESAWSRQELRARLAGSEALICLLTDRVDGALMDGGPELRIIANVAVGYDNIDVEAATERGIVVTNTPDVLTDTTADLALALMLAVARRIPEADALMRSGAYQGFELEPALLGSDVYGKTLGIAGLGRIGAEVARRAALGFRMNVIYSDPGRKPTVESLYGVRHVPFAELLAQSDFISLHAPLTPETRHLFTWREFRQMKRSAFLINTARGPLVAEADLAAALEQGVIQGAALDVFEQEPAMHPTLVNMRNRVVVAPHVGSATYDTRLRMATLAVENVVSFLRGDGPLTPVNR